MSTTRICIKCQRPMEDLAVEEVVVDHCPSCHGLWLDRHEINQLAAKSDAVLEELRQHLGQPSDAEPAPARVDQTRPCPACGGKLSLVQLGRFAFERCLACNGIFLDQGELDRALELLRDRADGIASLVALAGSSQASGTLG